MRSSGVQYLFLVLFCTIIIASMSIHSLAKANHLISYTASIREHVIPEAETPVMMGGTSGIPGGPCRKPGKTSEMPRGMPGILEESSGMSEEMSGLLEATSGIIENW